MIRVRLVATFFVQISLVVGLCSSPQEARADQLSCEKMEVNPGGSGMQGVEREPRKFAGDTLLLVERCGTWMGHAYTQQRYNVSVWEDGERIVEQTLHVGITTGRESSYEVDPKAKTFELRFGCGGVYEDDVDRTCKKLWRWSDEAKRFLREAANISEAQLRDQFDEHLEAGRFDEAARAMARMLDLVPGPENGEYFTELTQRLLAAMHQRALAAHEKGEAAQAEKLARRAFTSLDELPTVGPEHDDEFFEVDRWHHATSQTPPRYRGSGAFFLPYGPKSARIINDLGYFIAQGGEADDLRLARRVYLNVLDDFPRRWVAHLNLADANWQFAKSDELEGRPERREALLEEARAHYEAYKAHVPEERVPKRVGERIGETGKE